MILRSLTISLALISGYAQAGDTSSLEMASFADDGRKFVFIEKGVTDGLGAPYLNAYGVDVEKDAWLEGFPIRKRMNESQVHEYEEKFPGDYPTRERKMKQSIMDDAISETPLKAVLSNLSSTTPRVANTPWELSASPMLARFTLRDLLPSSGKAWRLDLVEKDFPAGEECYGFVDTMKGYRLTLTNEETGTARVLHDDERVPKSRGCPLKYTIANVYSHTRTDGSISLAALLRFSKPGFEGPDRRLMAVTTLLPKQ